jgi:hypothetical protein
MRVIIQVTAKDKAKAWSLLVRYSAWPKRRWTSACRTPSTSTVTASAFPV